SVSTPEVRYRSPGADRFAASINPFLNPNGSIFLPTDEELAQIDPSFPTDNADSMAGIVWYIGEARFRHDGLGGNGAFADGSVRTLFLHRQTLIRYGSNDSYDSDFRRNMLMIKWPPGIVDSHSVDTDGPTNAPVLSPRTQKPRSLVSRPT